MTKKEYFKDRFLTGSVFFCLNFQESKNSMAIYGMESE